MSSGILQKHCPACQQTKTIDGFARNRSKLDGLASYCKTCTAAWMRGHYQTEKGFANHRRASAKWRTSEGAKAALQRYHATDKYKETVRRYRLLRKYGLTLEDYDRLVQEQQGKCKICGRAKKLVVDHCHRTGMVRGLLCYSCNTAIGKLGDNAEGLKRATSYLTDE